MRLGRTALLLSFCAALFGQRPATVRFVYAVSGAPAAGVTVEATSLQPPARYTTDRSGRIPVAVAAGRLRVTDPQTGTVLLDRGFPAPPGEVTVGIPIRLTGLVSGFGDDAAHVEIDCGYGDRVTVSDYQRRHHKLQLVPRPNEDTIHGLALPRVHDRSLRVHPDAAGRFTTGWFAAMDSPELLVFAGADTRAAAKTIQLSKGIKPRTTVAAGKISPSFGATLEVRLNVPKTDLPLGLLMGVTSLEPAANARQQMAASLSAIHRLDPTVSLFLARRREIPLSFEGVTRLAGLPPIESLKLHFGGPITGVKIERTVRIPAQGVVRIDLSEEDVLGKREPRTTFNGVIRFEGGSEPVANATVVYSSYPDKKEAKTGPDGRFQIPGVVAGRNALLLIDMPNPGGRPPFDRITVTKPVPPQNAAPAAAGQAERVIEVKRPAAGGFLMQTPPQRNPAFDPAEPQAAFGGVPQLQQNLLQYQFQGCNAGYTQDTLQYGGSPILTAYLDVNDNYIGPILVSGTGTVMPNSQTIFNAQFPGPGEYELFLEYTPFVFSPQLVTITQPATTVFFQSLTNIPAVQIQVIGKNGAAAPANVELQFFTWSPEPDPFAMITDSNGRVTIQCVTYSDLEEVRYLPVSVDDPTSGYYSGDLPLTSANLTLTLADPPGVLRTPRTAKK